MIFFFKPKKIHLDCFTNRSDVFSYFPIVESTKTFPEWWKKLPKQEKHFLSSNESLRDMYMSTMKSCVGFIDYYKNSISLQLWSDLLITSKTNNNFEWQFADEKSSLSSHPPGQYDGFVNDNKQIHFKLETPWFFSCNEDLQFLNIGNVWNQDLVNKITILNGLLNFKYQNSTNINLMFNNSNENTELFLPCGTNLVNYFPLSEKPIKIHNHLISDEEYKNILNKHTKISFVNKYKKIEKIVQQNENKCPFGFKK